MWIPRSNSVAFAGPFRAPGTSGDYPPRRVKHYSPGLQPWVSRLGNGALKVAPDVSATGGINTLCAEQTLRSPLSGRSNFLPYPGLKPWAILLDHFIVRAVSPLPPPTVWRVYPGLKPWAVLLDHFMVKAVAWQRPITNH